MNSSKADALKAPFPYFGGKSTVAPIVWERFGQVRNYVEPFFGSGAMLLSRPDFDADTPPVETVNDKDGFVANFWRALQADPEAVAHHADWPVNENDLHARHAWLVGQRDSMQARLEGDPDWFDVKVAGWWCWGMCCWIGSGFCSGAGPWRVVDGQLVHLGTAGQGINRQRVHLGNAQGINRQLVHLGDGIKEWMEALAVRMARVRVCCGDWGRVCGPTPTIKQGLTAVFLDPPYSIEAGRNNDLYRCESGDVAHAVREWAIEWGDNPKMRIALCGYDGEHDLPDGWECFEWKARGGYANEGDNAGRANAKRERIWFSPHCLNPREKDMPLFAAADMEGDTKTVGVRQS